MGVPELHDKKLERLMEARDKVNLAWSQAIERNEPAEKLREYEKKMESLLEQIDQAESHSARIKRLEEGKSM